MSATSTAEHADQASRLRSMVQTVYGPGVTMLTYQKPGVARPRAVAPSEPARRVPVVAITSGKGGVGKTCLAVNLCVSLARQGYRPALLDADLGLANADLLCGLNPVTRLDASLDPEGRRSLDTIAVDAPGGFKLIPGSAGLARMANLPLGQRSALVRSLVELEAMSDVVVVDTGAGLSDGVLAFVGASDLALVVATPEPTSIADAYAMIKVTCRAAKPPRIALVVNQAEGEDEGFEIHRRVASTCKKFLGFDLPLYGTLRKDGGVGESVRARLPVALGTPRARFSRDVALSAERVAAVLSLKPGRRPSGLAGGLLGWIRGR